MRSSTASLPAVRSASTPPTSSDGRPWPSRPASSIADTRDQVATLNAAIRARRVADGNSTPTARRPRPWPARPSASATGSPPDATTATSVSPTARPGPSPVVHDDGALEVATADRRRVLPRDYAVTSTELAYASTAYGAQGQTVDTAHVVVGDHSGAAATYVGMSRGRGRNVAHLVADTVADARSNGPAPSLVIAPTWVRRAHDSGPSTTSSATASLPPHGDPVSMSVAMLPNESTRRQVAPVAHEISKKVRLEQDTTGLQVLLFLLTAH